MTQTDTLDHTHAATAVSWVESANRPDTDFPLQNLPLGIVRSAGSTEIARGGVAIGDYVLDLKAAASAGAFAGEALEAAQAASAASLNPLLALGNRYARRLRHAMFALLNRDNADTAFTRFLLPREEAELLLPAVVGDFTDFYTSVHHATHAGSMFRPENPLLPNYKWLPVAYHGRSSSIVASGSGVRRPFGQVRPGPDEEPVLRASRRLDYEAEIGFYVGAPTRDGEPVSVSDAGAHVFGFSLVNDWSARDIQAWEYQPLGPFLGKNFATTVSPWIVTTDALAPFRTRRVERAAEDPQPLAHLQSAEDASTGAYDIEIDVLLQTAAMCDAGLAPHRLSRGRFSDAYWTVAQMVAHHTSNGCGLRSGDLIGSGTISGEERSAWGSLLELSWNGTQPLSLPNGEQRTFLEDGDEVILRGSARRAGFATIGFGECRGQIHGR